VGKSLLYLWHVIVNVGIFSQSYACMYSIYHLDQDTWPVVYHVAQEGDVPHAWDINRKNNNAIFTYIAV